MSGDVGQSGERRSTRRTNTSDGQCVPTTDDSRGESSIAAHWNRSPMMGVDRVGGEWDGE